MRRGVDEHGSAGLMAVWVAVLVMAATTAAVVWGGAVAARHRAGRTADLAALAAARALVAGSGDPCRTAARVAAAASAGVTTCAVLPDGSVLVVVEVPAPAGLPGLDMPPARGRARAGGAS